MSILQPPGSGQYPPRNEHSTRPLIRLSRALSPAAVRFTTPVRRPWPLNRVVSISGPVGVPGAFRRWLIIACAAVLMLGLMYELGGRDQLFSNDHQMVLKMEPQEPQAPHPLVSPVSQPLPLGSSLDLRLKAWENSPDWTDVNFTSWSDAACKNTWPSHNNEFNSKSKPEWNTYNSTFIESTRRGLINHLKDLEANGALNEDRWGSGKGMVFTAGNRDTLEKVVVTLRMLRQHYHSTLPAQIFHFPSEKPEEGDQLVEELEGLGAVMVEAVGSKKDPTRSKNYHLKALAVVQSPFREVLYIDSDNTPTQDPSYLFSAPAYRRLRAFFWPDYFRTTSENPIWPVLGVPCRDEWEMEAGQFIVDKKYHLDAMLLSQFMLENWRFWFNFSDGDKDIFRFAFLALRKRWAVSGRYVGVGGLPPADLPANVGRAFCGLTMVQYDHLAVPIFIHYNMLKGVPPPLIHEGFSWGRTQQFPTFILPNHHPQEPTPTNQTLVRLNFDDGTESNSIDGDEQPTRGFGNVDCDMLANADDEGVALAPATSAVRRRAATERGARMFFHGDWAKGLACVGCRYDDPRPEEVRDAEWQANWEANWRESERRKNIFKWLFGEPIPAYDYSNSLGIVWGEEQYSVVDWKDDPLLKDFEKHMYEVGFQATGH